MSGLILSEIINMLKMSCLREKCLNVSSSVIRLGLGIMFVISSTSKFEQPYLFLGNIFSYELVPAKMGILVAMIIPWFELIIGCCLLGQFLLQGAFFLTICLMSVFVFAHASAICRGLSISCGCFSSSEAGFVSSWTLLRNIIILLLAMFAACVLTFGKRKNIGE